MLKTYEITIGYLEPESRGCIGDVEYHLIESIGILEALELAKRTISYKPISKDDRYFREIIRIERKS